MKLPHRPDIDGLRALAILPVVLFHFGFSGFPGGYVGVDVFFIISGFLITSIVRRELVSGRFRIADFYERRIRRIFPALFAVFLFSSLLALFLLLPRDLESFSESLAAGTVFGANFYFREHAGYFDAPAEMKPLLHIWSLSVEEQFYIVFPILLLVCMRWIPRWSGHVLALAALASFAGNCYFTGLIQDIAFYLPQWRAWELLLGALLALNYFPLPHRRTGREILAAIGLALIVTAVTRFSRDTEFPGWPALLPTLGATLLIAAGIGVGEDRPWVNRLLSWRPLVLIGLISYSLYLWHWPILVFAKYLLIRELNPPEKLGLLGLSCLVATLSWRYVERPFRGKSGLGSRTRIFAIGLAGIAAFGLAGLISSHQRGFPKRLPAEITALLEASAPLPGRECQNRLPERVLKADLCKIGVAEREPTFLVWGDSHAKAILPAIEEYARQKSMSGLFAGKDGCRPLIGVHRYDAMHRPLATDPCFNFNEAVKGLIERHPELHQVVLSARWALDAQGARYGNEAGKTVVISPKGAQGNPESFRQGLEGSVTFLRHHEREVAIISQVPEVGWDVPSVLARTRWYGIANPLRPPQTRHFQDRQATVQETLQHLVAAQPIQVFDVAGVLCGTLECRIENDGKPLYRDQHHLSAYGVQYLIEQGVFKALFRAQGLPPPAMADRQP